MILPKHVVPTDPRIRRRWWAGLGLVATGGALVAGSAIALATGVYQAGSSTHGGGLSGGAGSIQLSFTFVGPPASVLALWVVLGLVPLLAIISPRTSWLALGASVALGFFVGTYVLASLLLPPFPTAVIALYGLLFSGACLNCVGSWLLHRTKNPPGVRTAAVVRLVKRRSTPTDERRLLAPRE